MLFKYIGFLFTLLWSYTFIKSQSILDIFEDLDYNTNEIIDNLLKSTNTEELKDILREYLQDNGYLKTTKIEGKEYI